jgi:hypothetical protein
MKQQSTKNLVLGMSIREDEILTFDECEGSMAVEGRMATTGGGRRDDNNGNTKEERRREGEQGGEG